MLQGHVGVALRDGMNQQGLWAAGFRATRGEVTLDSHGGMRLACLNNFASWWGGETHQVEDWGCSWSRRNRKSRSGAFPAGWTRTEDLMARDLGGPVGPEDVKAAHGISGCTK